VGLRILREVGIEEIRAASLRRTARIIERADAAGLGVFTPREPERRGGIVTLRFEGDRRVQAALLERGIITSYRSGLRIGPHFFNTDEEVEQCMDALTSLARRPS
jgi:selenocysteine lyase/cysteine desulfurase